jgi:hypothetical protein
VGLDRSDFPFVEDYPPHFVFRVVARVHADAGAHSAITATPNAKTETHPRLALVVNPDLRVPRAKVTISSVNPMSTSPALTFRCTAEGKLR